MFQRVSRECQVVSGALSGGFQADSVDFKGVYQGVSRMFLFISGAFQGYSFEFKGCYRGFRVFQSCSEGFRAFQKCSMGFQEVLDESKAI